MGICKFYREINVCVYHNYVRLLWICVVTVLATKLVYCFAHKAEL